jgi:F-type H+-transporting ATPase subunit delta
LTAGTVARRYARALADVAAAGGELERVQGELEGFDRLLADRREVGQFLRNPGVPRPAAIQAADRIAEAMGAGALTRRFLRLLLQAGRLEALRPILDAYAALADQRLGRLRAEVVTAVALPEAQLAQLRERLGQVTGRQVYLTVRQDPSLLGGLVTRIGSQVYDGSLKTQLARMRHALLET